MELSAILPHVEALIFASEKPLTSLELTELINNALGFLDDKITLDQIESAVAGVIEKYDADFYPFEIRESGGGWQFLTKKDYHKTVAQLNGDKFLKRLSAASLETLAIIAYKQPITKGEIESIRGVNSDYSIQKLLEKELIIITGRNEELPGKPLVYATSKTFMDYFGINSPDELPSIKDVLSSQVLEPTQVPQPVSDGLFAGAEQEDERPSRRDAEMSSADETAEDSQALTSTEAHAAVDADDRDATADEEDAFGQDASDEETDSEDLSEDDNSDDLVEGDLIVRANGELTSQPEPVVEDMAEIIDPEQVIGEDEPDDLIAAELNDEFDEIDESEDSADYATGDEQDELADSADDDNEPASENEDSTTDLPDHNNFIDDNSTDEDTDPYSNPSPEKE